MNLLYKLTFIRLSKKKVDKWYKAKKIEKLIFALENGLYDVRIKAAKYLGDLGDRKAISVLRKSIHDEVKPVSIEACSALRKLTDLPEIKKEIEQKFEEWKAKDNNLKKGKLKRNPLIPKWKKNDWLAIVKNQLKKPMR